MRNEIKAILARLKEVESLVEVYVDTANEERQEILEAELDAIQEAIEALESIE